MKKKLQLFGLMTFLSFCGYAQAPEDFIVTVPNTNVSWDGASNRTVSWNVAGTEAEVPYVDILLSTNGGVSYDVMLAEKVPNDGSEFILVPDIPGTQNRISVQKNGDSTFFDASDADFTITAAGSTMAIEFTGERTILLCHNNHVTLDFSYETFNGFDEYTFFSVSASSVLSTNSLEINNIILNTDGTITLSVFAPFAYGYTFPVTLIATSDSVVKTVTVYIVNPGTTASVNYTNVLPANNAYNVPVDTVFQWDIYSGEPDFVEIEIATDQDFTTIVDAAMVEGETYTSSVLDEDTLYFWRLTSHSGPCSYEFVSNVFYTGTPPCPAFTSLDVPVVIPEAVASTVTSSIAISDNLPIVSLSVDVDITHASAENLTVKLRKEGNPSLEIILFDQVCPGSANVNATFSDDGEPLNCGSDPGLSGVIIPQESLSAFADGWWTQGTWTLVVTDNTGGNGGVINNWNITMCTQGNLGTEDIEFKDFTLWPNPNNGNFSLKFNSTTGNEIKIIANDMSGRQLLNRSFANTGLIEQDVYIGNVSTGMYLISIHDGESVLTKKIMIE